MAEKRPNKLLEAISLPLKFIIFLWIIHLFQVISSIDLGTLGVYPRTTFGLRGILFMPLLHADWGHLISNTPPLFALSTMVMYFYRRVAIRSFVMIYLLTGLAVWLFGNLFTMRAGFHIGASGLVYGLVSFVFWNGVFRRNLKSIVLALIVLFYYGSMFTGILPGQEGISWEGHLFGALVGILASFWFKNTIEKDETKPTYSWEEEPQALERPFLDPNIFEQTKEEKLRQERGNSGWFSNDTF